MATPLTAQVKYKVKRATRATDPPISWVGTEPTILVQAAEVQAAQLSPAEQEKCQRIANTKKIGVEFVIKEAKLQKAGEIKYAELKAAGLFKWPGARRSSLHSAETVLVTPAPAVAPTTSTGRSLLGNFAGAAGRFLTGVVDSSKSTTPVVEDVEVSLIESVTDSVAGAETEESEVEEKSELLETSSTAEQEGEVEDKEIKEASEEELEEFEQFKKYRWPLFSIPVITGAPEPKEEVKVVRFQITLGLALEEDDLTGYYNNDLRAIRRIKRQKHPWKQLGTGTKKELLEHLFHGQFTTNDEGEPSKVYLLYSEYLEVIKGFDVSTIGSDLPARTIQRALVAKLQLAFKYGLLTDKSEAFWAEEPTRFIEDICVNLYQDISDVSSDKSDKATIMATLPLAIQNSLDIAKEDIDQSETAINNHASLALDQDDIESLWNILGTAETKLEETVETIYAIQNISDVIANETTTVHKTYHNKVKKLKLQLSKIQRKLGLSADNQQQKQSTLKGLPLPKLELTKFGGKWDEWLAFQDLFTVTIMNRPNDEMDPVLKFQYLRQSLYGPALQSISGITVTGTNLQHAWKILTDRYNDPRKLLDHYCADMDRIAIDSPTATKLYDTYVRINNNRHHLKKLGIEVEANDPMLVSKFATHFDYDTKCQYEMYLSLKGQTKPTWEDIGQVIQQRCRILEGMPRRIGPARHQPQDRRATAMTAQPKYQINRSLPPCFMCQERHFLRQCNKFTNLSVDKRGEFVREKKLCVLCFSPRHNAASCPSQYKCKTCNLRHNTLLHYGKVPPQERSSPRTPQDRSRLQANASNEDYSPVLLPTVQVLVRNAAQEWMPCRALLDTGSQSSFITERAVQRLRLKRSRASVEITGIGNDASIYSKGSVNLDIRSASDSNEQISTPALILPQVTEDTPTRRLSTKKWAHLQGLQLADPSFNVPGKVDILLGADVAFRCLNGMKVLGQPHQPVALSTTFGYVVAGTSEDTPSSTGHTTRLKTSANLSIGVLQQFWGAQGLPSEEIKDHQNEDDRRCEDIFKSTTKRCTDGKLEVSFPFRTDPPEVGLSKDIAVKRLAGTEARLARNPELRKQYEEFMADYESQGHMVEVKHDGELDVYLPHHPIIRTTVLTTKLRVVFDASAKTANGKSLNEAQFVGPVIQDDLFAILTRFRLHKVAINGDIAQMYRQIWISPQHQDYQRILWRRKPADPISMFQLRTVTYGTASAPWLATRALKFIAVKEQEQHPEAAKIIAQDFYMDDLMSGADDAKRAHRIQEEVSSILLSYGFPLRKWASNDEYVLNAIQGEQELLVNPDDIVKTLGLKWNKKLDAFQFNVKIKEIPKMTKRAMISEIACTFDPLGFAAPVMVLAKILYQDVWRTSTEWDDELPTNIHKQYQDLRTQLAGLEALTIPRWLGTCKADTIELHVFSDASEKAYGACVYLRNIKGDNVFSNLVASKTRVAPLKTVSLPRLELMGAVLGSQLMEQVAKAFRRPVHRKLYWTDSMITLGWIQGQPGRFKTFIANRVATIQELSQKSDWRHVGTKDNPADLCSRGIYPKELKGAVLDMWLRGPPWLQRGTLPEPSCTIPEAKEELKKVQVCHATTTRNPTIEFINSFSSLSRLVRITALFGRLGPKKWDLKAQITPEERKRAFGRLLKVIQKEEWGRELKALTIAKDGMKDDDVTRILKRSNIANLNPMLDEQGLLRVGGRLGNSEREFSAKHPALLPYGHLAKIYMRGLHVKHLHAGPTLLLATARKEVWPVRGPQLGREIVRKCIVCSRWRGTTLTQQMGNLPASRLDGYRAFHTVGVDYAGPVSLKTRKGRGGGSTIKTWIAVFVCFATKAVHLELVSELSSEAFIAALRRFIARRGIPQEINSDNGTNFIGANKELGLLLKEERSQNLIREAACKEGIKWNFIPPSAPHQGGLWESSVKSMKHHLRRVLGAAMLTGEEFSTVLCQVEAILNSRPLCPLTEDSSNFDILTPGHFLIGQPLNAAPDPDLVHIRENRLNRWQYLQRLQQEYWARWHTEYLSGLQKRYKWQQSENDIKLDALVLIKEENMAPLQWRRGRVVKLHPGNDGRTRVVTLRTAQGEVTRPIVKLVPLGIE